MDDFMYELPCTKCTLKASDIDISSSKRWKCPSLADEYDFAEKTKKLINYEDRKTAFICDMGFMYAKLINNDYSLEFTKNTKNLQMYEIYKILHDIIYKYKGIDDSDKKHVKSKLHHEIGCFNIMSISDNSDDILVFNHFISKYNIEWDWHVFGNVPENMLYANKKKYSMGIDGDGLVSVANIKYMKISIGNIINLFICQDFNLSNIMMGFTTLKKSGSMIVPFDSNIFGPEGDVLQNLNILYLLSTHFTKLYIINTFILERPYDKFYIFCENYVEMNGTVYNKIMNLLNDFSNVFEISEISETELKKIHKNQKHKYIDFGATDEFIEDFAAINKKLVHRQCTNLARDINLVEKYKNADISDVTKSMKDIYKQSQEAWCTRFKFVELEDIDKMDLFKAPKF